MPANSGDSRGYSTVFQPMCGIFTPAGSFSHVPGTSPSPSHSPSSYPTSASSCKPRQMPRNGVPSATRSSTTSRSPLSFRFAEASRNAPTPGNTIAAAPATSAGSSVTRTPFDTRMLEALLDAPEVSHPVVDDGDAWRAHRRASPQWCERGRRAGVPRAVPRQGEVRGGRRARSSAGGAEGPRRGLSEHGTPARTPHHSVPLVDGTPLTRGSSATASASARATALNAASTMW